MRCAAVTALAWASLAGTAQAEDLVVNSFDGTPIVAHWFPNPSLAAGQRAPVVLNGPGWSAPGENDPSTGAIKRLHDLGYNVLTWDPRGFGVSGGEATINAPQVEGRDVRALIDRMAEQPEVKLDKVGDPRVGMTGGSYGGGIQLSTAGIDRRVDAIVPVVAWHSLETSLYKDRTFKQGWNSLLYSIGLANATNGGLGGGPAGVQTGGLDPHITSAYNSATATGTLSAADEAWFRDRGPGDKTIRKIKAPTLLVGGTVDTLFPLDEDVKVYRLLRAPGNAGEDVLVLRRPRPVRRGQRRRARRRARRGLHPRQRRRRPPPQRGQRRLAGPLPQGRPQREDRARARVPLGRPQVPRGASVPRRARQAGQGARLGHPRDRAGRHLRHRHPGRWRPPAAGSTCRSWCARPPSCSARRR